MHKQRGLTLLETLVVVAIAVAVIGGIMFRLQVLQTRERNEDAVRIQGLEMSNLAAAARQYAETEGETWADGTRHEVTITELVDAGLLPEGFGDRGTSGTLGQTPLGQMYRVFSIKDGAAPYEDPDVANGTVRTVIVDLGTPVQGRMERAGISTTALEALLVFKEAVAMYATREERLPMGVIDAGGGEVRGVGRSFTKDVIDWIENNAANAAAVALVGFPDLEGSSNETGPTGGVQSYCDDVRFVEEQVSPVCPSGYIELAREKVCGRTDGGAVLYRGTEYGMVSVGRELSSESNPDIAIPQFTGYGTSYTMVFCGGSDEAIETGVVNMDGMRIGSQECTYFKSVRLLQDSGLGLGQVCSGTSTTLRRYPTMDNVNARALVCCLPHDG